MDELVEILARAVAVGIGGAAMKDAWVLPARRAFHIPAVAVSLVWS
jgi:hypothetical protein